MKLLILLDEHVTYAALALTASWNGLKYHSCTVLS